MIISFAWTTKKIRDRTKTATRRFWKDRTAKTCKVGSVQEAWDKSPRFGGKKICDIKILAVYKEQLLFMTDEHFEREGGLDLWPGGKKEYIEMMGGVDETPWVIEFGYID